MPFFFKSRNSLSVFHQKYNIKTTYCSDGVTAHFPACFAARLVIALYNALCECVCDVFDNTRKRNFPDLGTDGHYCQSRRTTRDYSIMLVSCPLDCCLF